MKIDKKNCLELVITQISNMLYNNINYGTDGIAEKFIDWCENADIFEEFTDRKLTQEEQKYCCELMNRIAPFVDNLTNELYNIFEEIENEDNQ